jgi:hypothetical protein
MNLGEDPHRRRALLKMAMLGGGAALAGLMRKTADAEPAAKVQIKEALAARHPINDERSNEFKTPDGSVIQGTS